MGKRDFLGKAGVVQEIGSRGHFCTGRISVQETEYADGGVPPSLESEGIELVELVTGVTALAEEHGFDPGTLKR